MIYDASRKCFRYWWACLPALPASRDETDWSAEPGDGRAPPYRRLRRVWNDPTWFKAPRADPLRRHEFSSPSTGTHATVQLWENWSLFHPSVWVSEFLRSAGFRWASNVRDACWSYEFADPATGKLADVTLHVRDEAGTDTLVVIEAKWNKDSLKATPRTGLPDTHADAYVSLRPYSCVADRRMLYLVHEIKANSVRSRVERDSAKAECEWSVWTWESMVALQCRLAAKTLPVGISDLVAIHILAQASAECIDWAHVVGRPMHDRSMLPSTKEFAVRIGLELDRSDMPSHLVNYLKGAKLYWECRTGQSTVDLPFEYLRSEPSFEELHHQIAERQKRGAKTDAMKENVISLWKLPPFRGS